MLISSTSSGLPQVGDFQNSRLSSKNLSFFQRILPKIAKFFQTFGQNHQYFPDKILVFARKKTKRNEKQDVQTNILGFTPKKCLIFELDTIMYDT